MGDICLLYFIPPGVSLKPPGNKKEKQMSKRMSKEETATIINNIQKAFEDKGWKFGQGMMPHTLRNKYEAKGYILAKENLPCQRCSAVAKALGTLRIKAFWNKKHAAIKDGRVLEVCPNCGLRASFPANPLQVKWEQKKRGTVVTAITPPQTTAPEKENPQPGESSKEEKGTETTY